MERDALGAGSGIAVVVALLFSEAISPARVFFYRDIHAYWYQQVENLVGAIAASGWPLWNPYPAFGGPMLAEPAYQLGYPFTWLNFLLLPATYYKALVMTHELGTGLGLYLLARALGLRALPAFVGSAAWVCSGPLLSSLSMTHHFTGAAWMPWVLLALRNALARRTVASSLGLGASAACQILAGSGDMCAMTALLAAILTPTLLRLGPSGFPPFSLAKVGAVSVAFALALSAVQWLPAVAILPFGSRHLMGPESSMYWSVHPLSLLDLVFPGLIAEFPMSSALRAVLFEGREPFLSCLYLGAGAASLVALAVSCGALRGRAALALGALLLVAAALGRHTPLHLLLVRLPLLGVLRYPVKYLIPASLLWSLLLAAGLDAWQGDWSEWHRRRARFATAAALGLASLAAFLAFAPWVRAAALDFVREESGPAFGRDGLPAPTLTRLAATGCVSLLSGALLALRARRPSPSGWLTAGLAALVLADSMWVGHGVNRTAPAQLLTHRPPLLQDVPPQSRLFVFPYPASRLAAQLDRGPADWEREWRFALGLQELLVPPIGARWRLYGSYDGDFTGLAPAALTQFSQLVVAHQSWPLGLRLLQLGSVDYVVALHPQAFGGLPEIARHASVFAAPIRVFRVPAPLPRAYVVSGARVASGPSAFAALADPAFDPRMEVVLPEPGVGSRPRPDFSGSARILGRRPDRLELEAELDAPGFLVITEAYHPDWVAMVDQVRAEVLPANILFRAVAVPAGKHAIELSYRPRAASIGALVSGAAALFGIAFSALRRPAR